MRCVKPNRQKVQEVWDGELVETQLRSSGVFEAVRVIGMGFPDRLPQGMVTKVFSLLVKADERPPVTTDDKEASKVLLLKLGIAETDFAVGNTKVLATALEDLPPLSPSQPLPLSFTAPPSLLHSPSLRPSQPLPSLSHSPFLSPSQPLPLSFTAPPSLLHSPFLPPSQPLPPSFPAPPSLLPSPSLSLSQPPLSFTAPPSLLHSPSLSPSAPPSLLHNLSLPPSQPLPLSFPASSLLHSPSLSPSQPLPLSFPAPPSLLHNPSLSPSQVLFKAGVVPELKRRHNDLLAKNSVALQAAGRGLLGRRRAEQERKDRAERLRIKQGNAATFMATKRRGVLARKELARCAVERRRAPSSAIECHPVPSRAIP